MSEPHIAISLEAERIPWGGQEYAVNTTFGLLSVFVCGDQRKPALMTYSDIALNYMSCFQGLFFCADAASLLFHNFCIYHIDAPGHELGAAPLTSDQPFLSPDDLADQVAQVFDYFGLPNAICMGVMAGAYILSLFALNNSDRVLGLILISPLCRSPSWSEWFINKLVVNLLYFYGMSIMFKDTFLSHTDHVILARCEELVNSDSDIVQACRRLLDERQSIKVMHFLHQRRDLTICLKKLTRRILMFAGEHSPFYDKVLHMSKKLDRRFTALVEVQACGSLVTEEQPHSMLVPIEYFLMGYGFYRMDGYREEGSSSQDKQSILTVHEVGEHFAFCVEYVLLFSPFSKVRNLMTFKQVTSRTGDTGSQPPVIGKETSLSIALENEQDHNKSNDAKAAGLGIPERPVQSPVDIMKGIMNIQELMAQYEDEACELEKLEIVQDGKGVTVTIVEFDFLFDDVVKHDKICSHSQVYREVTVTHWEASVKFLLYAGP
ncbi:hypothetical protein L7F22_049554 [Adiantum nelumboides]|nr:hypothetical protein [Adiantum nelumboides]